MIAERIRNGLIAGLTAVFAVTGLAAAAFAQEQQAPQPSLNKQIGDWTVVCYSQGGATNCRMNETLLNKKTRMPVLSVSLAYIPDRKMALVEAIVPLNVALQNGVTIGTDTYSSGTLQYNICVQQGCQTVMPADSNVIGSLSHATKGAVEVVDYSTGKKIKIGFPLDGFNEAYQTIVSSTHSGAASSAN